MKLLKRNTDYAVRAVSYIAKTGGEVVSVSELVKSLKIPRPFLRKILQALTKEKMLKSYKGKGGGFRLTKKPDGIFLVELIEIFQGPLRLNECLFKKMACPHVNSCKLKRRIDKIEKTVASELKKITVGELING